MSILNKCQWLVCFVLVYCCVIAHGQVYEMDKRELKFELSKEMPKWEASHVASKEVTHFARIHLLDDRHFGFKGVHWSGAILNTKAGKLMSEKQRHFISGFLHSGSINKGFGPFHARDGKVPFEINTVSEQDVHLMIESLLEYFNNKARSNMEKARKEFEEAQKTIAELEKNIPELEKKYKHPKSQVDKIIKDRWESKYGLIDRQMMFTETKESMKEFTHKLVLLEFEVIELQAKMDMINKFKGTITDQSMLLKLDQMLIIAEVEFVGILAKKKAFQKSFEQGAQLLHMMREERHLSYQIKKTKRTLVDTRTQVSKLEQKLADPPPEWKSVSMVESKVVIFKLH